MFDDRLAGDRSPPKNAKPKSNLKQEMRRQRAMSRSFLQKFWAKNEPLFFAVTVSVTVSSVLLLIVFILFFPHLGWTKEQKDQAAINARNESLRHSYQQQEIKQELMRREEEYISKAFPSKD